jgi:hypothetical protein
MHIKTKEECKLITPEISDYADTQFIYVCKTITEKKYKYTQDKSYLSIEAHAKVRGHAPRQYLMHTPFDKHFLLIIQHR